jgi:cell wall-associated NlpC family hydrolase
MHTGIFRGLVAGMIGLGLASQAQAWPEWQPSYPEQNPSAWQYVSSGLNPDGTPWTSYVSPYAVSFGGFNQADLLADFSTRTNLIYSNTTPNWSDAYNQEAYDGTGVSPSWGPQISGSLGAPTAPDILPAGYGTTAWQQQKVIAYAMQYQFVSGNANAAIYQHHHLPQWNPYTADPSWPWSSGAGSIPITWGRTSEATSGQPSLGVDCSDFTSLVYNTALGIQLETSIAGQGDPATAIVNAPEGVGAPLVIVNPIDPSLKNEFGQNPVDQAAYLSLIQTFQPGDLLYMQTDSEIGHVVIWIGTENATFNGGEAEIPLVISSHNNTPAIWDENGVLPPPGVQVLPFSAESWFYRNYDHALRITAVPEPSTWLLLGAGGIALALLRVKSKALRQPRRDSDESSGKDNP